MSPLPGSDTFGEVRDVDDEWDAWYEQALARSIAETLTTNGLVSAASIAYGAAQVLCDEHGILTDDDRARLVAIVHEHTRHLFESLRQLAEPGAPSTIDLGLEAAS